MPIRHDRRCRRIRYSLLLTLWLVSGCAVNHVSPKDPAQQIPDRSAAIPLGQIDRLAVQEVLGTPIIASDDGGFELFRADTEQHEVVFALTPWPIPFARFTDQLQRYTLVTYTADGRAHALATGLFRRPAAWRNVSPIERDYLSLSLRVDDLLFFVTPDGTREANLLALPPRRDRMLHAPGNASGCTVVLGCGNRGCPDQLSVDADAPRRLPLRLAYRYAINDGERDAWLGAQDTPTTPWLEALVALRLSAGAHTLQFSARHLYGTGNVPLTCRAGEISYLQVDANPTDSLWSPTLVDWQFSPSLSMPAAFNRRPLVLVEDGQPYGDQIPSRP